MKRVKTYWWFWGLIPILLFVALFFGYNSVIDIPVHDTYYVIAIWDISIAVSLVLFISGCGYLFRKIRFNPILNIIHFIATYLGLAMILIPNLFAGLAGSPRKYYSNTEYAFLDHIQDLNMIITLGVSIFLFGIIIYLINLGIAISKKLK